MTDQQTLYIHPSDRSYSIPSSDISINDLSCNNIVIGQISEVGSAQIESVPPGAKIYIDDKLQTLITPARINDIPIGVRIYKLTYPGYVSAEGVMTIEAGEIYDLFVVMEKIPTAINPLLYLAFGAIAFGLFMSMIKESR